MKPVSVFTQGPKVGKDRKKALALDANNPRVHYLTGVSFWFAPEILGGSDKALEHLKIAEALFEKEEKREAVKLLRRQIETEEELVAQFQEYGVKIANVACRRMLHMIMFDSQKHIVSL